MVRVFRSHPLMPLQSLLPLAMAGCAALPGPVAERSLLVMGTELQVIATGDHAAAAAEGAVRAIQATDSRWSTWRPGTFASVLDAAPTGQPVPASASALRDWHQAATWSRRTAGAFDPTVGALLALWGPAHQGLEQGVESTPTPTQIARARSHCGLDAIQATASSLTRLRPGALASGGFAKGIALDDAIRAARAAGDLTEIVVELGGQLRFWNTAASGTLEVGVAHPDHRHQPVTTLTLPPGSSVATSGNSERPLWIGGTKFSHILDPRTGRPAPDWGSVTVVTTGDDAGCAADCLSTACYVLGPTAAVRLIDTIPAAEVLCLERTPDGLRSHVSAGMPRALKTPPPSAHSTGSSSR